MIKIIKISEKERKDIESVEVLWDYPVSELGYLLEKDDNLTDKYGLAKDDCGEERLFELPQDVVCFGCKYYEQCGDMYRERECDGKEIE